MRFLIKEDLRGADEIVFGAIRSVLATIKDGWNINIVIPRAYGIGELPISLWDQSFKPVLG